MRRALQLAALADGQTSPNPLVGAVILDAQGDLVGEGFHAKAGEAHAEVGALAQAGVRAKSGTLIVTLEPCCHQGRTPPCSEAVIQAGIQRVVVALKDPDPRVAGGGIQRLRDAGLEVITGVLQAEAAQQNRAFVHRVQTGRPWGLLKWAMSLDGRTALPNGESQWITGEHARADVQKLRAQSGAIMTGSGTVLNDNPALTVRDNLLTKNQPLRVIVDSRLNISPDAQIFKNSGHTWVFCIDDQKSDKFDVINTKIIKTTANNEQVDIPEVLKVLAANQVNNLLIEAGPVLAGTMLTMNLIDELVIYQAPHIMGSEVQSMFYTPTWTSLTNKQELTITEICKIGKDIKIIAKPL